MDIRLWLRCQANISVAEADIKCPAHPSSRRMLGSRYFSELFLRPFLLFGQSPEDQMTIHLIGAH